MLSKKHGSCPLCSQSHSPLCDHEEVGVVDLGVSEVSVLGKTSVLDSLKGDRKKICQYLYEEAFKIVRSGQNRVKMSSKRKLSQQARPVINSIGFKDDDGHVARGGGGG